MLSRLLATAGSRIAARNQPTQSASTTADPALYSGEHRPGPDVEPHVSLDLTLTPSALESVVNFVDYYMGRNQGAKSSDDTRKYRKTETTDTFTKPKSPLARVESAGVRNPSNFQQKRKASTAGVLESVSCVGFDGTEKREDELKGDEDEDEESNKEYFRHHKASPLSEIKFADTRKPITRASDGTAGGSEYGGGAEVIGWRAEQLESAEETMRKAMETWKQNAMRGDPETFPHYRVLRELRGEWF